MVPGKFDRYKRYLKEKKKQENIAIKKRKPFYNPNLDKLSKSVKNLNYHDFLISRYWDEVRKIILIRDKNNPTPKREEVQPFTKNIIAPEINGAMATASIPLNFMFLIAKKNT